MNPSGISQRTATGHASPSSGDTIPAETSGPEKNSSSVPANASFYGQMAGMQSLFGGLPSIGRTARKASNARYSGTKARIARLSLSDRQTQSLITAGLIAGTTPSLIRGLSGAAIRDFVFLPLDGGAAE